MTKRRRVTCLLVHDRVVVALTGPQHGLGFFTNITGDVFDCIYATSVVAIVKDSEVDLLVLGFGCTGTGVLL